MHLMIITLAKTLECNEQLNTLELKSCNVSSEGVLVIADMLMVNTAVLHWNG